MHLEVDRPFSAFNRNTIREFELAFDQMRPVAAHTLSHELVKVVHDCYRVAAEHRCATGVQESMEYSLAAYEDRYDAKTLSLIEKGQDVFVGLTSLKCRAAQGWMADILVNSEDKPWVIAPTPQPQLPARLEQVVVERLAQEIEGGRLSLEQAEEVIPRVRAVANKHAQAVAQSASEGMQDRLLDLMLEGGWRKVFDNLFVDVSVFPAAIVRGPVVRTKDRMRWRDGRMVHTREPQIVLERVSPFDFFPSPDSTTPQDGSYVIDRIRMSRQHMIDAMQTPGFDEAAIRRVMSRSPSGTEWWGDAAYNGEVARQSARQYETGQHDGAYKALAFYGKVQRKMLMDFGVAEGDPHEVVEAEIWVVDNEVIRAEINARPLNHRPFSACRFQPVPGSFWGRSLPQIVRDPQRIVNAAARALVRNMGFASGPMFEMDESRLEGEPEPQNIQPWRVYQTRPDLVTGSNAPAIRTVNVPSIAAELQSIADRYALVMDDLSGIPAFAIGSPQTSGAGRTLGGLSMLLGNAARGIKRVISDIDKSVIEPTVEALYHLEMVYGEDQSIKMDAQIIARGSSGLLQRQLNHTRAVDLLQIMAPFFGVVDEEGRALVPVQGLRRVMHDIVRSMGYTSDEVLPDPDRGERLQLLQAVQNAPTPTVGTPPPALDGRSMPPPGVLDQTGVPLAA